jgi:hypothetical protein
MRSVLQDQRVGLIADAVFAVQGTSITIFKDSGDQVPTDEQIQRWHEAAWNLGAAPLLWIVTPIDVRLYDCYAAPVGGAVQSSSPLDIFKLDAPDELTSLNAMCGRLATETGAFWSSPIGKRIDRRRRVDRELLNEITALEEALTIVPAAHNSGLTGNRETKASRDFAQRLIGRCIFSWYLLDRQIAQPFLPSLLRTNLDEIFASRRRTFALFNWLRKTFGGDLFPMDDPGAEHHRLAAANPSAQTLEALDRVVAEYYGLEPDEGTVADESIERARMLVFEGRAERQRFTRPPSPQGLKSYSAAVIRTINSYLRAIGARHLQATVYERAITVANWEAGSSGLTAVRFSMCPGAATTEPIIQTSDDKELDSLGKFLLTKLQTDIAPYINERRLLRIYLGDNLFVVKPNEIRYWTQTSGLNDADIILADHWAGGPHATSA